MVPVLVGSVPAFWKLEMGYTRSNSVTLVLEADEDGNLDLVDCYDEDGSRKENQPKGLTDVGWVKEEWSCVGFDMIGDEDLRMSSKLVVKGHMWCDGPDWEGDYDGGFDIDEIIERKPMIKRFSKTGADGSKAVVVTDCPECHMTHIIADDGSQFQVFDCGEGIVSVYVMEDD